MGFRRWRGVREKQNRSALIHLTRILLCGYPLRQCSEGAVYARTRCLFSVDVCPAVAPLLRSPSPLPPPPLSCLLLCWILLLWPFGPYNRVCNTRLMFLGTFMQALGHCTLEYAAPPPFRLGRPLYVHAVVIRGLPRRPVAARRTSATRRAAAGHSCARV